MLKIGFNSYTQNITANKLVNVIQIYRFEVYQCQNVIMKVNRII